MDVTLSMEFLAELTGISSGDLSSSLKDGENLKPTEEIQSFLKNTIGKKLKDTRKAGFNEGHGKGMKESLTNLEKELVTEYGFEGYKEGETTVKDIVGAHVEKSHKGGSASSKLTPEAIKASDVYRADLKTEIDKRTAIETEFTQYKDNAVRERTLGAVKTRALSLLDKHKFMLPDNENIRTNAVDGFIGSLTRDITFKLNDKGDITEMLDKNNAALVDSLMNKVTYEDHVVNTAKGWFEIRKDDGRSSPGALSQPPGAGGHNGLPVVKSSEEFYRTFHELDTFEKKDAFYKQYEQQLKTNFS